jgi:Lar family restriction alleviation protein
MRRNQKIAEVDSEGEKLLSEVMRARKEEAAAKRRLDRLETDLEQYSDKMARVLKPCPFCGGRGSLMSTEGTDMRTHYWVICQTKGCEAHTAWSDTERSACDNWNRRSKK